MFLAIIFGILKWTFIIVAIILVAARLYLKTFAKYNNSFTCLIGKTAIVTGANTGIGYYTALDFASRGARVILGCRDAGRANEACERIKIETGNDNVHVKIVDLGNLESVRKFCKEINQTEERIDILVNNAAVAGLNDRLTDNGVTLLLQVNYFSQFLLTVLLIKKLIASKGRIVNVASMAAKNYSINNAKELKELCVKKEGALHYYSFSKMLMVLFTRELACRLKDTGVRTYSLHPGAIKTDIFRHLPKWVLKVFNYAMDFCFLTSLEGAQTTIYCAVSPNCKNESGLYYDNCQVADFYESCKSLSLAKDLWVVTEDILQMTDADKLI